MQQIRENPTHGVLNVARQLLKDNGVVDLRAQSPVNHLANNYPEFEPDEYDNEVKEA